jgi:hypothetical protein
MSPLEEKEVFTAPALRTKQRPEAALRKVEHGQQTNNTHQKNQATCGELARRAWPEPRAFATPRACMALQRSGGAVQPPGPGPAPCFWQVVAAAAAAAGG